MAVESGTPSAKQKATRPFYTRNRRNRPCDGCRRRKTRCDRPADSRVCLVCSRHGEPCTYVMKLMRNRPASVSESMIPDHSATDSSSTHLATSLSSSVSNPVANSATTVATHSPSMVEVTRQFLKPNSASPTAPTPGSFKSESSSPGSTQGTHDGEQPVDTVGASQVYQHMFLCMNEFYYCKLIENPCYGRNLQWQLTSLIGRERFLIREGQYLRPVAPDTTFLVTKDEDLDQDKAYFDLISDLVDPYSDQLLALYFQMVHKAYPIIHKESFFWKHKQRLVNPALLGAMYLLAMNWWRYDRVLASKNRPDITKLRQLTMSCYRQMLSRPRLSTIQAGILLLQKKSDFSEINRDTEVWTLTSELVATVQTLGLHLNCSNWTIPSWEVPPRRTLAWAVYIQDKWTSAFQGLPCRIADSEWFVTLLDVDDFEADPQNIDANSPGALSSDNGGVFLIEMVKLTIIVSKVMAVFYSAQGRSMLNEEPVSIIYDTALALRRELLAWFSELPETISYYSTYPVPSQAKELVSYGYIIASYFAAECLIQKIVIRAISYAPVDQVSPELVASCRSTAIQVAADAVKFVAEMKLDSLESFWIQHSNDCIVEIGSFISLLQVTASPNQEDALRSMKDTFRWQLQIASRTCWSMEDALQRLESLTWKFADNVVPPSLTHLVIQDSGESGHLSTVEEGSNSEPREDEPSSSADPTRFNPSPADQSMYNPDTGSAGQYSASPPVLNYDTPTTNQHMRDMGLFDSFVDNGSGQFGNQ